MRLLAAVLVLAAPLAAQNCAFTVSPTTFDTSAIPYTATTGNTVRVTAPDSPCDQRWIPGLAANSTVTWIHIPGSDQGVHTGSGTFTFSVDANPFGATRSGDLALVTASPNTAVIHVTQAGAPCKFGLTPSSQNFPYTGGVGLFAVQANCAWAASNNASFVTLPNSGGTADASVQFTVAANTCYGGRSGTINVFTALNTTLVTTVTQDGSPSNFTLSATSATLDGTASDNRFTLTTGLGCGWSAASDVSWMSIISGSSGQGSGAISYHLLANTSGTRTGNIRITVAPNTTLTFAVTQRAAASPTPTIASVNNAASYATDAVSPGQIVTLFGGNLGPSPLVPLQVAGGALTTSLGGTQVLFDGVAVPMIYSFQTQVSAIAPYSLAGKSSTQVQVKYNGVLSDAVTVPVQASTPAIFSLDATGLGPGAILNQDFGVNGPGLAASRGSIVAIYCTGGGTTNPASTDGAIVSGLPVLTLPATVTIGGIDAPVSYKGGVPGSIAGLTQINAQVPANAPVGGAIPIRIKIGDVTSTAAVTIAVK